MYCIVHTVATVTSAVAAGAPPLPPAPPSLYLSACIHVSTYLLLPGITIAATQQRCARRLIDGIHTYVAHRTLLVESRIHKYFAEIIYAYAASLRDRDLALSLFPSLPGCLRQLPEFSTLLPCCFCINLSVLCCAR